MDLHEIKKTISRPELLQIAETVARDKSIEQEIVIKSMEQAIQSVAKRKYGQELDVKAEINRKTGEIELGRVLNVVENIENPTLNNISINPEPYVIIPTLGETLDYNFTFSEKSRVIIRIFDISGRFITSLIDKYYDEAGIVECNTPPASWNGKDQLGQIVSPGTYIMYIEAMNPLTGKTYTDSAPIVVGVKN